MIKISKIYFLLNNFPMYLRFQKPSVSLVETYGALFYSFKKEKLIMFNISIMIFFMKYFQGYY